MSALWSPYALDVGGQPYALSAPPALRAIGGQLTAVQAAMAQDAFARFCSAQRYSLVPNPSEISRLPDGTAYRIDVVGVQAIMQVWPAAAQGEEVRGAVYLGGFGPVTKFTFARKNGIVTYKTEDSSLPAHNRWYVYGLPPYGWGFPGHVNNLTVTGVFGDKDYYFYVGEVGIVNNKGTLRQVVGIGSGFGYPRLYQGLGYVLFRVTLDSITQDDGTVVFTAPEGASLTNVSIHPREAKVTFDVVPVRDYLDKTGFIALGYAEPSWNRGPGATATYLSTLRPVRLPTYPITKKELSLQPDGKWAESLSEVVPPAIDPADAPQGFDFKVTDYTLSRLYQVEGVVNIHRNESFTSISSDSGGPETGGTCFLEASYHYEIDNIAVKTFDSAGQVVTVSQGLERGIDFSAQVDLQFPDTFVSHAKTHSSTSVSREWYEIDGRRLYTTDAEVSWAMSSTGVPAASEEGATFAGYGAYEGSARLHVKCQRRNVLRYDPEMKFACYIEEQAFEYLWEPSASCAMLYGSGENMEPYPGVPLEGSDEMVPVPEPVLDLVMTLDGVEVLRERIGINSSYILRTDMIPVTSAYLQPQVDALPPEFITLEEYRRRIRILLCSNYQCEIHRAVVSQTSDTTIRENYIRMTPSLYSSDRFKQLDDYFLRQGAFQALPEMLRTAYIHDGATTAAVMTVWPDDSRISFEGSAYVVTKDGVTKHPLLPGQDQSLTGT
jgi:hypothetical protein